MCSGEELGLPDDIEAASLQEAGTADTAAAQDPNDIVADVAPQPDDAGPVGDDAVMPSAEEIALARAELTGLAPEEPALGPPPPPPVPVEPAPAEPAAGEPAPEPDADAELEKAKEAQETAALLSNIASVRHDTNMSIINNMR